MKQNDSLQTGIEYSMHGLICDIISCYF